MSGAVAVVMLLLSVGFSTPCSAAPIDWNLVHATTLRGIDHLYSLRINEARASFDSITVMAPTDPRGHFFRCIIHFWLYEFRRDPSELAAFYSAADTVIDVCEAVLDRDGDNAAAHFFLGGMYGYRGIARQQEGSMLGAVSDGRKGYSHLERAVTLDPTLYDAQMGLGIFKYMIAKAPRTFSWVLRMLGYDGDIEGGMAALRLAAERGTYARTEASFYLAQFLYSEGKHEEAFARVDALTRQYPDNTLFLLTEANWYRWMGRLDEALHLAERAAAVNERRNIDLGRELAYSTLAGIQFTLNRFDQAQASYRQYLRYLSSPALLTNFITFRIGLLSELFGDRARALEYYAKAHEPRNKDDEREKYFLRKCRDRMTRPVTASEILAVRADNELAQKQYETAFLLADSALAVAGTDPDLRALPLHVQQRARLEQDRYAESIALGQTLELLSPRRELWLIPQGLFVAAQAYEKLGNIDEARRCLKHISDFDDYDYQSNLENRVDEELRKLP